MSIGLERLYTPSIFDICSPFVAFFLVIMLPIIFGIYVIVRVVRGDYPSKDQRAP